MSVRFKMSALFLSIPSELIEAWQHIAQPGALHTNNTCIWANQAFVNLFGYFRTEEVIEKSMGEFVSPWSAENPRLGLRGASGRRKDGTLFEIEVITLPLLIDEELVYQSLFRDVTELRSWEGKLLQTERLTAMGKLAGEIAHEINNPLGGILLYANLIKEDIPSSSQTAANLEKIIKLATRCRIIAKGLLNFGRSSSKTYVPVDLNKVVQEMFMLVSDHKLFRQIRTHMQLAHGLPLLMGDKGQIEQVVLNLIINAVEAMNGKGRLHIVTQYLRDSRCVRLIVEDTGPGIPEEILHKIFEPFFTTKRPGRGTGLGLSITHGIVQRHGGRIGVESVTGKGTRFEVTLPLKSN